VIFRLQRRTLSTLLGTHFTFVCFTRFARAL
jgi:hypothetical protein